MLRHRVLAATALVLAAVPGTKSAEAQISGTTVPRFELAVYGGGAVTGDWFNTKYWVDGVEVDPFEDDFDDDFDDRDGDGPGFTAAFGGSGTWYLTRTFGLRLHYSFMPSEMPRAFDVDVEDGHPLNIHAYDLNLAYRPWAGGEDGFLASTYLFAGGGALTSDPAGGGDDDFRDCASNLMEIGACLPLEGDFGTVGQGVIGTGFNLFALGPIGVYTEFALRGYDSPVHTGYPVVVPLQAGAVVPIADDSWAFTGSFVAGLVAGIGDFDAPVVPVAFVPPAPVPLPPPPPPPPAPPPGRPVSVCVVDGGGLTTVEAMYMPNARDTVVAGQKFATRYPGTAPTYAAPAPWFTGSDSTLYNGAPYVKFGVTRVVQPDQLLRAGDINGTSVFVGRGESQPYQILYVPVRPGCEFQPYRMRATIRPRG